MKINTVNNTRYQQCADLTPKLFELILRRIELNQFNPDDTLLFGLKGQSLHNKQLNRITNKICEGLGWGGEEG